MTVLQHRYIIFLTACLVTTTLTIQAAENTQVDDFVFGTWELVLADSVFIDREVPQKQTRIYTPHPQGVEARIITLDANGVRSEVGYAAAEDGVPHPTYGTTSTDEIILERTGPHTATATFAHAGREVGSAERVISMDGTRMSVSVTLYGNLVSRAVYRRIE